MKANHYKFLILTITDWDEPPRARHQVAYALAKKYPVVFVSSNRMGFPKFKIQRVSENLNVIIPSYPVDYRIRIRIPFLNRLYQNWLFTKLGKDYKNFCVINFDFVAKHVFPYFKHVIYYCNDDHIGLSYLFNMRYIARYQDFCERSIAEKSTFCIGTSKFLTDKLKQYNPNTFEIRLGAPSIDFLPQLVQKQESKPINVGLVGFSDTINFDLFLYLLSRKDLNYTLIGPVQSKHKGIFTKYKNVKLTGKLTGNDLYKEVSKFDVGIVPYNLKSTIDRTPNKLWLYLALGVPVVVSKIESIDDWVFPEDFIYLADSPEEFYTNIIKAHEKNSSSLITDRITFARDNSWDIRMLELLKLCDTYISKTA